jgi:hypothetical protein
VTDRRPPISEAIAAFGFTAQVYLPGVLTPVSSGAFWLSTRTGEQPAGEDFARAEGIRTLVLPLSAVGAVPRGTVVVCPPFEGEPASSWRVEQSTRVDYDHHRCVVIPNPS